LQERERRSRGVERRWMEGRGYLSQAGEWVQVVLGVMGGKNIKI